MKDADADAAQCKHNKWNAKYLKKTDADAEADADQCKRALRPAQTTADQVLNSLLFGDLLYFVTGNDKDEPKFCNMRFDMD